MKTAVCVSGLPKLTNETWQSFCDNFLANFPEPDVFIYTGEAYPVDQSFFDRVMPKRYVVEQQFRHAEMEEKIRRIGYHSEGHINSLIQQFYGMKKAWELKKTYQNETGVKYDLVARVRADLIYLRPITLDMLELDKINTLHSESALVMPTEFAIGPDSIMEKYFGMYDWLAEYGEAMLPKTNNPRIIPEYNNLYSCDTFMTTYLIDFMGVQRAKQKLPVSHCCPYQHYRIMYIHKNGSYGPVIP